jgi:G3E family GTPase
LNKYDLVTERELDSVLDHLYELNDETPMIRVSKATPLKPELVFGLDTKLFERGSEETADWEMLGADGKKETHMDEIETRSVRPRGMAMRTTMRKVKSAIVTERPRRTRRRRSETNHR